MTVGFCRVADGSLTTDGSLSSKPTEHGRTPTLPGCRGKQHRQEDGSLVYGWGQVVLFDTARYWYFMDADVTADC